MKSIMTPEGFAIKNGIGPDKSMSAEEWSMFAHIYAQYYAKALIESLTHEEKQEVFKNLEKEMCETPEEKFTVSQWLFWSVGWNQVVKLLLSRIK